MRLNLCGGVVAGLCLVAASASATTLVTYDLNDIIEYGEMGVDGYAGTNITANPLAYTSYMSGPGRRATFDYTDSGPGWLGAYDYIYSIAPTNPKGFTWTLAPMAGKQMTLTSVSFEFYSDTDWYDSSIHGPSRFEVRSSQTGSSAIYTTTNALGDKPYTVPLSGFANLTVPVTFYIYPYQGTDTEGWTAYGLAGTLSVTGTTSVVPEPSIVAALGVVLMPMLARRQRRAISK